MSELYESIEEKLESYYECQLDQIPEELRNWLLNEFFFQIWDGMSAHQRRSAANQYDYQHDPQYEAEREFDFNRFSKKFELQGELKKLQKMEPQSVTEHELKRKRIEEIQLEISSLENDHPPKETPKERAIRLVQKYKELGTYSAVAKDEGKSRTAVTRDIKKGYEILEEKRSTKS